jgi:hypothetical protein
MTYPYRPINLFLSWYLESCSGDRHKNETGLCGVQWSYTSLLIFIVPFSKQLELFINKLFVETVEKAILGRIGKIEKLEKRKLSSKKDR